MLLSLYFSRLMLIGKSVLLQQNTYYNEVPGTLIGGDDEVILASPEGAALDSVKWNRDWGFEAGIALQWIRTNIHQHQIHHRAIMSFHREFWRW